MLRNRDQRKTLEVMAGLEGERRRDGRQRRADAFEMFTEHTRIVGPGNPATILVRIPFDMVFLYEWSFKLLFQNITTMVPTGTANATVNINDGNVTVNDGNITINNGNVPNPQPPGTHNHTANPHGHTTNPHGHTAAPHNHNITAALNQIAPSPGAMTVSVGGNALDVLSQYSPLPSAATSAGDYYPIGPDDEYDMIESIEASVGSALYEDLLSAGFKEVTITSAGMTQFTFINYLQYTSSSR